MATARQSASSTPSSTCSSRTTGGPDRLPEPWRSRTTITAPPRGHLDTGNVGIDLDGRGWPLPDRSAAATATGRLVCRQGNRKYAEEP